MKKTIFAFLTLAAFSAFSQSGIVNPVSLRDLRRLNIGTDFNLGLVDSFGNFIINNEAGYGSSHQMSVMIGQSAGMLAGGDHPNIDERYERANGCFFLGVSAGRESNLDDSTCIGQGAGWGAYGTSLLIIDQFVSNDEAMNTAKEDSLFFFDAYSRNLKLGRPSGNIQIRGTNVTDAVIVTNLVQQRDGSGYVTNIILQGINGKVIQ